MTARPTATAMADRASRWRGELDANPHDSPRLSGAPLVSLGEREVALGAITGVPQRYN